MWSSSRVVRTLGLLLALAAPLCLAACSGFTPVYGPGGIYAAKVALVYDTPSNQLEQIIYEDLALKLGKATGSAPKLTVTVSRNANGLTSNAVSSLPNRPYEMVVKASVKLVDVNGKVLFQGSRSASAGYTTDSQVLANSEAADEAARRAAKSLADTIRLTLLGVLTRSDSAQGT